MNDFKNAYQSAVQDMDVLGMKEIHIDAASCMDERRHKRCRMKQVQRATATAFSAICIICVCSLGTVKAAGYLGNVIKVSEWGFRSGDAATMARNDGEISHTYILEEEVAETEEVTAEAGATALQEEQTSGIQAAALDKNAGNISEDSRSVSGNGESVSGNGESVSGNGKSVSGNGKSVSGNGKSVSGNAGSTENEISVSNNAVEAEPMPVKKYASWEELKKDEDILFPQPSISIGRKIDAMDITVCGDWAMVRYDVDGKVLWLERTDYADTQGHAASKVFPGGVCNERSYTDAAGYTYTLVDSVKGKEEEPLQIHAAVSVGSYEVFMDFIGYGEEEARKIIDSVNLSLYE